MLITWIFDRTIHWKWTWTWTFCSIRGRRWIETKSLLEINLHDLLMFYLESQFEFRFISVFLFQVDFVIFSVYLSLIYKNCKNPKKDENRKNHKSLNPALNCLKLLPGIPTIKDGLDFLFRFKNYNYSVIITHWLSSWSVLMRFCPSNEGLKWSLDIKHPDLYKNFQSCADHEKDTELFGAVEILGKKNILCLDFWLRKLTYRWISDKTQYFI